MRPEKVPCVCVKFLEELCVYWGCSVAGLFPRQCHSWRYGAHPFSLYYRIQWTWVVYWHPDKPVATFLQFEPFEICDMIDAWQSPAFITEHLKRFDGENAQFDKKVITSPQNRPTRPSLTATRKKEKEEWKKKRVTFFQVVRWPVLFYAIEKPRLWLFSPLLVITETAVSTSLTLGCLN